jgi:hypothetical protein
MNKVSGLTWAVAASALVATAFAATPSTRIRGTIQSANGHNLVVKTYAGNTSHVQLTGKTKYAWVVHSSLKDINKGDFIGVAATGPKSDLKATEVVIFPDSMRGMGEGHYPWSMPAAVAHADMHGGTTGASGMPTGAPPVKGTMTNGTVSGTSGGAQAGTPPVRGTMTNGTVSSTSGGAPAGAPPVKGTMTNGTVSGTSSGTANARTLTVTYNHGHKVRITVPANAPVVHFEPAHKSILANGQKVFVMTGSGQSAAFVAVGKNGLMPPM